MSGGKGGSTTSSVEVPQYIEDAARRNLERADLISKIGYVPYYGPEVAAMTPAQEAAFAGTQQLAGAFGTPTTMDMGVPAPQTFAGGMRGYSSAPMFEEAMDEFGRRRPAQKAFIDSLFIDPFSGAFNPISTTPLDMGEVVDTTTTTTSGGGGGGGGGGGSSITTNNDFGNRGGTSFTTYGGSQDVANQAVIDAFADYGKEITAGTAKPEDNPAFNAGIKAANENAIVTYLTNDNQIVSKKKGDLTSADFNNAAKIVDQNRLAADSMLAAGIRNIGAGFAQDDPTTGLLGSLTDAKNFILSELPETAAQKEAAAKAAADRRKDRRREAAEKGRGAFAKRTQKTGVGGRNIGGR